MATKESRKEKVEKVEEKSKKKRVVEDFTFTVNSAKFSNSLKIAASIVPIGNNDSTYILKSDGKKLWVLAKTEAATLKLQCKGVDELSGTGFCGFDFNLLQTILKGRSGIKFTKDDTTFNFKAVKGAYGGDFITMPVLEESIADIETILASAQDDKGAVLNAELLSAIQEGLAATSLTAVHSADPLDSYIQLSKGKLEISSSDNWHLSFYEKSVEDKKSTIKLSAPKSHFDTIAKLTSEFKDESKSSKFYMDSDAIRVIDPYFRLALPSTQSSDTAFQRSKDFITNLPKTTASFSIKKSVLLNALQNITSVYEEGTAILVTLPNDKDILKLATQTTYGSVNDTIKVTNKKGSDTMRLDPVMVLDLLGIATAESLSFNLVKSTGFIIKCGDDYKVTYVGAVLGDK